MPWQRNKDNISPGKSKGIKARKSKGRILPATIRPPEGYRNWMGYWSRDRETRPLATADYKPFQSKPIKRKERRGQAKPRG